MVRVGRIAAYRYASTCRAFGGDTRAGRDRARCRAGARANLAGQIFPPGSGSPRRSRSPATRRGASSLAAYDTRRELQMKVVLGSSGGVSNETKAEQKPNDGAPAVSNETAPLAKLPALVDMFECGTGELDQVADELRRRFRIKGCSKGGRAAI